MYSAYKRQRILHYYSRGYKPPTVSRLLREEGLSASRRGIDKFLLKFQQTGSIGRRPGSGRPSKFTTEMEAIVEEQMQADDETTASQLHRLLVSRGHKISLPTILRCRKALGWTFRGSAYCQLIRHANKQKRLDWARQNVAMAFEDVVWTDECTVQLQSHRRFCCRKRGQPVKNKPRLVCVCACALVCTYMCVCACVFVSVHVRMHMCVCTCAYARVYVHVTYTCK